MTPGFSTRIVGDMSMSQQAIRPFNNVVGDSVMRSIVRLLGSSLVIRREELRKIARQHKRSDSTIRQILYLLRRRRLIHDWGEHVINVPLLVTYIDLSKKDAIEALIGEGFSVEESENIVSEVSNRYLKEFSDFVNVLDTYCARCRTLIDYMERKVRIMDEVLKVLVNSLGLLLPEAKQLAIKARLLDIERDEVSLRKLLRELAGVRFVMEYLSGIQVDEDLLKGLESARRALVSEIELISADTDRHSRYYSKLFLRYTALTALTKILPRYHVTLVLYKKIKKTKLAGSARRKK